MRNALLFDGLEYWRRETPDKLALILDNEDTLTYAELGRWSDGVAAELQSRGVRVGDRVGVTGSNSLEWVVCAMGALKAGAVLTPMNERFVRDEFAYLIATTEPAVIIADAPRAETLKPIAGAAQVMAMEHIAHLKDGAPPGWTPARPASDSVGVIIFTSGTTGRPKGVMYGHEENIANYFEIGLILGGLGSETVHFMPVSLQSAVGVSWGFLFTTTVGGTICFMRKLNPALALRTLVERKVTFFPSFPGILEQIGREPGFDAADLSSLVMVSAGGARVSAGLLKRWREKGVALRQMYGQTEVGGFAILGSEKEAREGRQSCGRPMVYKKIRVVDPEGKDRPPGEPGEIWVNGPGMMLGYWKNPEATAQTLIDGWVRTGDLGVFDEEGYLTFVDRLKDMIISGGFNISPSEVEAVIGQAPGVLEVAVFPVADDRFGETPAAVVYADPPVSPEAVFEHCKAHLAGFKLPRYVIPAAEPLPRLSSNKIAKRQMAADYADAPKRFAKLG